MDGKTTKLTFGNSSSSVGVSIAALKKTPKEADIGDEENKEEQDDIGFVGRRCPGVYPANRSPCSRSFL